MDPGAAWRLVEPVMALWVTPIPEGPAGEAAFATCYAERLAVKRHPFTLADVMTPGPAGGTPRTPAGT